MKLRYFDSPHENEFRSAEKAGFPSPLMDLGEWFSAAINTSRNSVVTKAPTSLIIEQCVAGGQNAGSADSRLHRRRNDSRSTANSRISPHLCWKRESWGRLGKLRGSSTLPGKILFNITGVRPVALSQTHTLKSAARTLLQLPHYCGRAEAGNSSHCLLSRYIIRL